MGFEWVKDEAGDCDARVLLVSQEKSFDLSVVMAKGGWDVDFDGLCIGDVDCDGVFGGHGN